MKMYQDLNLRLYSSAINIILKHNAKLNSNNYLAVIVNNLIVSFMIHKYLHYKLTLNFNSLLYFNIKVQY